MTGLVLGLNGDGWLVFGIFTGFVAATIVSALLAVAYGASRYRNEQELRDIRRSLVDNGSLRLKGSLDAWLEVTRRNYAVANHLLRYVKDVPYSSRLRPRAKDLPALLPTEGLSLTFDAVVPAGRLLGPEIGALVGHAFADLYALNLNFQTRISQPVRSYYLGRNGLGDVERLSWHNEMQALADDGYKAAEKYAALSNLLGEASLRFQELQVASFADIGRVDRDATIVRLRGDIARMLDHLQGDEGQASESSAKVTDREAK